MSVSKRSALALAVGLFLLASPSASAQGSATETLFDDMAGGSALYAVVSRGPPRSHFPNNVDCRDFSKTGYRTWELRDKSPIDLGNWDGAFDIIGPHLA